MVKPKRVFVSLVITPVCSSVWSGNFSVGVEAQDYLPISEGEGGVHSGYAKDLLDAFAAKYGHSFTYKPLPVYRLLDEFAIKKSVDFKLPGNTY